MHRVPHRKLVFCCRKLVLVTFQKALRRSPGMSLVYVSQRVKNLKVGVKSLHERHSVPPACLVASVCRELGGFRGLQLVIFFGVQVVGSSQPRGISEKIACLASAFQETWFKGSSFFSKAHGCAFRNQKAEFNVDPLSTGRRHHQGCWCDAQKCSHCNQNFTGSWQYPAVHLHGWCPSVLMWLSKSWSPFLAWC